MMSEVPCVCIGQLSRRVGGHVSSLSNKLGIRRSEASLLYVDNQLRKEHSDRDIAQHRHRRSQYLELQKCVHTIECISSNCSICGQNLEAIQDSIQSMLEAFDNYRTVSVISDLSTEFGTWALGATLDYISDELPTSSTMSVMVKPLIWSVTGIEAILSLVSVHESIANATCTMIRGWSDTINLIENMNTTGFVNNIITTNYINNTDIRSSGSRSCVSSSGLKDRTGDAGKAINSINSTINSSSSHSSSFGALSIDDLSHCLAHDLLVALSPHGGVLWPYGVARHHSKLIDVRSSLYRACATKRSGKGPVAAVGLSNTINNNNDSDSNYHPLRALSTNLRQLHRSYSITYPHTFTAIGEIDIDHTNHTSTGTDTNSIHNDSHSKISNISDLTCKGAMSCQISGKSPKFGRRMHGSGTIETANFVNILLPTFSSSQSQRETSLRFYGNGSADTVGCDEVCKYTDKEIATALGWSTPGLKWPHQNRQQQQQKYNYLQQRQQQPQFLCPPSSALFEDDRWNGNNVDGDDDDRSPFTKDNSGSTMRRLSLSSSSPTAQQWPYQPSYQSLHRPASYVGDSRGATRTRGDNISTTATRATARATTTTTKGSTTRTGGRVSTSVGAGAGMGVGIRTTMENKDSGRDRDREKGRDIAAVAFESVYAQEDVRLLCVRTRSILRNGAYRHILDAAGLEEDLLLDMIYSIEN